MIPQPQVGTVAQSAARLAVQPSVSLRETPSNPFLSIIEQITRPNPSITNIETRRQSRLLAALTLTLALTSSLAATLLIVRAGGEIPTMVKILIPGILFTIAQYFLNRGGRYQLSATLFIGFNFLIIHGSAVASNEPTWFLFASMWVVFTAILTPIRVTVLLFLLSAAFQVASNFPQPSTFSISTIATFIIFLTTSSMIVVFTVHRSALERERQEELRAANKRLIESEALLELRVAERTRELSVAKEDADSARARAEEADRVKSQFLSSMSHELRTPLNAILTFNELMAMGMFGEVNEEQVDYLQKSLASGRHLLSLINDVLDVTKIHSGMMKLFIEDGFDVASELDVIAASAEKMLIGKSVQVIKDFDRDIPPMRCDKRRIRQVLLNLMSNAVKFTEEGTITLSAKKRGEDVLFAVIDTGPGIAKEQQDIVFEPFIQTENGIKHEGGTGLGLPISKSLIEQHNGKIWVESTPPDGAAFYVSMPIINVAPISADVSVTSSESSSKGASTTPQLVAATAVS